MRLLIALLLTLASSLSLAAPQGKEIHYSDGKTEFHGYLAWDDSSKGARPGVVLNMARAGIDLDGVVSFHGSLATTTPASAGKTVARVLVYNGAEDSYVTPEQVGAFNQEMAAAKVDYRFINLPGAKHGFSNPDATGMGSQLQMDIAYDAAADQGSWAGTRQFLGEVFARR